MFYLFITGSIWRGVVMTSDVVTQWWMRNAMSFKGRRIDMS